MSKSFSDVSRYLLVAAAFVIIIAGMKQATPLLVPFLLSVFIAVLCLPIMHVLKERGLHDSLALVTVIFLVFISGVLITLLLGGSVSDFSAAMPLYQEKIKNLNTQMTATLGSYGLVLSEGIMNEYFDTSSIMRLVAGLVSGFGNALANSFLIFLTVIFILLESNRFSEKLGSILGDKDKHVGEHFAEKLRLYMGIKTLMSLATGALVALWLWFLDIDYPLLWGMMAFLLNYVPNVGSIIAAAPAVLLALVQFDVTIALLVIAGYVVINVVIGNVVEPRFLGKGLNLSPLVVFLSLVFWGWVLGPVGMVLSVPLTISVKLALDENEDTKWIGTMLGG